MAALAQALSGLTALKALNIARCSFGPRACATLVTSYAWDSGVLERLDVLGNAIGACDRTL